MLNKELQKIDKTLVEIATQLNLLNLIPPLNIESEKEKFFVEPNYNPHFKYKVDLVNPAEIEIKLNELKIEESNWQGILLNEVREKLKLDCHLAKQIGGDLTQFTELNRKKYHSDSDLPDEEILALAEKQISIVQKPETEKKYTAERVRQIFQTFLINHKIAWEVVIEPKLIPLLSVNYFRKQILINPQIQLSKIELERMLVHEIETHLYRYLNGKKVFQMASIGLKNYEKTEEGLAAYNESLIFPEDKIFLKRFYLRYKAVLFGQKNSFRKLYEYLIEEFSFEKEEGWRTALRIKRGINETSQAGAFLKDKIYLQGFFAVSKLSFEEMRNLYKGKFSLEHLDSKQFNLSDDQLIPSAKYLPSFYEKQTFFTKVNASLLK